MENGENENESEEPHERSDLKPTAALFGGAFDPPHNGHLLTVSHLLNSEWIDEVWLVPSGDSRYDKQPEASSGDRLEMLKRAVSEAGILGERCRILDIQFRPPFENSYTFDLVQHLAKAEPHVSEWFFVIGEDNVESVRGWHRSEELQSLVRFIVLPREAGGRITLPEGFQYLSQERIPFIDVSSSEIRGLFQRGKQAAGLVPPAVSQYVQERGLYRYEG